MSRYESNHILYGGAINLVHYIVFCLSNDTHKLQNAADNIQYDTKVCIQYILLNA